MRLIYSLYDPRTNEIRYIGKSSKGISRAFSHFKSRYSNPSTHKEKWVNLILDSGLKPGVDVLEDGFETEDELNEAERKWIAHFRSMGVNLTNHRDGGEGWKEGGRNIMHDPAIKARFSVSNRGRKLTESHKRNLTEGVRRPAVREKRSLDAKAAPRSSSGKFLKR